MDTTSTSLQGTAVRVLVLVEQRPIAELVGLALNHGVYLARPAQDLAEAEALLCDWQPHLAVVELHRLGSYLVERIGRSQRGGLTRLPILALTRRGDLQTKLDAFRRGIDDIMTLPFSPEELLARVLVITRRTYGPALPLNPVLTLGDLEINILSRRVSVGTSEVHLTALELSLLYFLAANAGRTLTRDEIVDAVWGRDYIGQSNIVDRHIRELRVKLQDGWHAPRLIMTEPGRGYRFLPAARPVN